MFDKLSARCVGLVGKLLSVKIGDSLVGLHLNVKKWSAKIEKVSNLVRLQSPVIDRVTV